MPEIGDILLGFTLLWVYTLRITVCGYNIDQRREMRMKPVNVGKASKRTREIPLAHMRSVEEIENMTGEEIAERRTANAKTFSLGENRFQGERLAEHAYDKLGRLTSYTASEYVGGILLSNLSRRIQKSASSYLPKQENSRF